MSYRTNLVAFRIPKPGEGIGDCQDSFMVDHPNRQCFALSDGVSRSFLPGLWSRMLVEYFKSSSIFDTRFENNQISEWFDSLWELWDFKVKEHFGKPLEQLPYYVRNSIRNPAYATLAVLELRPHGESGDVLEWKVIAIGDTCVFHFRERRLLTVIPAITSKDFSNNPVVIPSKKNEAEQRLASYDIPMHSGEALCNDRFYLATDALSQWILTQHEEQNYGAIQELLTITDPVIFQNWVIHHRNEQGSLHLESDDTSFISITIESEDKDDILQPEGWPTLEDSLNAETAAQTPIEEEETPQNPPIETLPDTVIEPDQENSSATLEEGSSVGVEAPLPPLPQEESQQITPDNTPISDGTPNEPLLVGESLLMRFWSWLTGLFRRKRGQKSRIQSVL